jgi:hypothetical protein
VPSLSTKLIPPGMLNVIKRSPSLYAAGRKARFESQSRPASLSAVSRMSTNWRAPVV